MGESDYLFDDDHSVATGECTFCFFPLNFFEVSFFKSKRALVKFHPKVLMKSNTILSSSE